jgi:carbamoyl-phosphate synthase large subunit
MDRPIITTVQQLGAAVQGIESARSGEISVRSLQEHAQILARLTARDA